MNASKRSNNQSEVQSTENTSNNTERDKSSELSNTFSFWFYKKEVGVEDYDKNLRRIGDFHTAEEFWGYYCHLIRPDQMPVPSDYHLFRHNIKPIWEDPENAQGGKWMVRTKKQYSPRLWEDLVLAFVGDQFPDDVTGLVLSIREHDILSVWTKSTKDDRTRQSIRNVMRRVLNLPPGTRMEFKAHNASLKEASSFKSTDIYIVPGPTPTLQGNGDHMSESLLPAAAAAAATTHPSGQRSMQPENTSSNETQSASNRNNTSTLNEEEEKQEEHAHSDTSILL